MEVIFYNNASDDRCINKVLIGGMSYSGQARDSVNIMNPVIRFDVSDVMRFNYAYIPELQRYYAITEITASYDNLYDVSFAVDVLMSFRAEILQLTAIVDKQSMPENGDEYIDDGSLVTDNVMFTRVHEFSSGFNDGPEYILITAG